MENLEKIKDLIQHQITINTMLKNEHVGEIERKIKHVKDRCHCITANLCLKHISTVTTK
jgi:hypothetical protein